MECGRQRQVKKATKGTKPNRVAFVCNLAQKGNKSASTIFARNFRKFLSKRGLSKMIEVRAVGYLRNPHRMKGTNLIVSMAFHEPLFGRPGREAINKTAPEIKTQAFTLERGRINEIKTFEAILDRLRIKQEKKP